MSTTAKILLVEDDKNLGYIIKDFLTDTGYLVVLAENGVEGFKMFNKEPFDLCLIDVMMPLKDGFSLAHDIRKKNNVTPIIFLTARAMKEDVVKGLKIGADDYITKPFSTEELLLRIEAILRRTQLTGIVSQTTSDVFKIGKFIFNYNNQTIVFDTEVQMLTRKEADLLRVLCVNMNNVVRRENALKLVWGDDDYFMGRSMDVYITKLRKILKNDPSINIINIHRTGFKLECENN